MTIEMVDRHLDRAGDIVTVKRRKVRKGTHSCWACKRRKEKCSLGESNSPASPSQFGAICTGCQRRGTRCVRQDFPEDGPYCATPDDQHQSETAIAGRRGSLGNYTPQATADALRERGRYVQLSRALYDSLPSPGDCELMCKAGGRSTKVVRGTVDLPFIPLGQDSVDVASRRWNVPPSDAHPVLIARHMLRIALLLQHCHPLLHEEIRNLSEPPSGVMERLAEMAISRVTTQDTLLGSIESVECIILESMYLANGGSIRRSWMANRRAMHLAQLMGLHLPKSRMQYEVLDRSTVSDPQVIWFRIIHYDRHTCLMLGLPPGSADGSMAAEGLLAKDTPTHCLERIHCVVAARVLERNQSDSKLYDIHSSKTLDNELQKAARRLPSKWWLTPTLGDPEKEGHAQFNDLRRILVQMFHYNLLNQIHVPYMLLSSTDPLHEYSKMTCANASREMLSRFVVIRSFDKVAFSCRTVDFLALMAAMTLLLAHLDSHRRSSPADGVLANHYLSDRAMIEQAQENMEAISSLNEDTLSTQSADLLRRLLLVDAQAAEGVAGSVQQVDVETHGTQTAPRSQCDGDENLVRVHIPYFGVIKIAREGIVSKEPLQPAHHPAGVASTQNQLPSPITATSWTTPGSMPSYLPEPSGCGTASFGSEMLPTLDSSRFDNVERLGPPPPNHTAAFEDSGLSTAFAQSSPAAQSSFLDPFLPGLTASADEWTFQGIDMAFFDSLMKNTTDGTGFGGEDTE